MPLLTMSGRVGLVPTGAAWPETSFQLLLWLSKQASQQLSAASPATTLFRTSQVKMPGLWVEKAVPTAAAADYADLMAETLEREQRLSVVRIAGRDEYLAALDEAVQRAVRGEMKPQEALRQAAARWREIANRLGLESQQKAYRASVGMGGQ